MTDHELAAELARAAGELLLEVRGSMRDAEPGARGDRGDRASHEFLVARLAAARPGDSVLSEEAADDPARLAARRVWIVDPLDGTREFAEPGRPDWAVHVALWVDGELTAGAVALPAQGAVFGTGSPAQLPAAPSAPRIVVSRSRPPALVHAAARELGAEVITMGSAGAKAMAILQGRAEAYVHAGGQYEWDSAAPVAVARAAGLHCSRLDGSALRYNQPDPLLPDLVVCRPELAPDLLTALRRA